MVGAESLFCKHGRQLSWCAADIPRATGMTGWDLGKSHPALTRFLASEKAAELDIPTKGKALVPGCGLVGLLHVVEVMY